MCQISTFTKVEEAIQKVEYLVLWGGSRWSKAVITVFICWSACNFPFTFNRNKLSYHVPLSVESVCMPPANWLTCWGNCWNFAEAWFCPWSHKVTSVCNCRSSFCRLLQLRVVHSSLPTDFLQSPVQAFIDCHLDLHSSTHWDNQGPDEATTGCSGCCNSSGAHGRDHVICHAITRRPSLVASGTASYLQNCCPRLDVYLFRPIYLVYWDLFLQGCYTAQKFSLEFYTLYSTFCFITMIITIYRLLLERGMLFRRLFVLRHHCCSSAATSRRNCFSHRTLHHSVRLCDRL